MKAQDVTATLDLALAASGLDQMTVVHRPRLLSDNGASYVAEDLAAWLNRQKIEHVRSAPLTLYRYLRCWVATRTFNLRPRLPAGAIRRSADNFRSLLSVADVCGDDWPQRAREALVILIREIADDQPKAIILRHGLLLFQRLEADVLEIGLFNRELHKLDEPGFDWNSVLQPDRVQSGRTPDQRLRSKPKRRAAFCATLHSRQRS